MNDQSAIDRRHVQILGIYHYLAAGSLLATASLLAGAGAFTSSIFAELPATDAGFNLIEGLLSTTVWVIAIITTLGAAFVLTTGYLMRRGTAWGLSIAVALLQLPLTGILGAFTLVVLSRDSVRHLFKAGTMAPPKRRFEVVDRQDAMPGTSWWRRNRAWSWPIALTGFITAALLALMLFLIGFIFLIDSGSSKQLRQAGLDLTRENQEVMSALGAPIELHWLRTGSTSTSDDGSGKASINLRINGPQARGWLHLDATRVANEWHINEAAIDVDGSDEPIVLLAPPDPCETGDWSACNDETAALFNRNPRNLDHIARRFHVACESGFAVSCQNLGVMHDADGEYHRDLPRAAALFVQACDLGAAWSCHRAGHMYSDGVGVDVAQARGRQLLELGCDYGDEHACSDLSDGNEGVE